MQSDARPSRIFEDISADLLSHLRNQYLAVVDRLSGWPPIHAWYERYVNAGDIIPSLIKNFADLGVSVRMRTDGGPQFASAEFQSFAKEWKIKVQPSTPHYPQFNGHAEAAVKAVKTLVRKSAPRG